MSWLTEQGLSAAQRICSIPDALLSPAGRDVKAVAIAMLERDWINWNEDTNGS